jgi:single-stranded-DNA-specific exonuclease
MELPATSLSLELFGELCALEPFGAGWPCPVFVTRGLRVVGEARVIKEHHLKFGVAGRDGRIHDAIWWGGVEKVSATPRAGQSIELAYTVESNTWNGATRLQLEVKDLRQSPESVV